MKLKEKILMVFHKPFDTSTIEGREKERARRIAITAITAMIAKAFALVVPLITTRITLKYLGEEIYGLWSAVVSFFALFTFADLGLGSGLQTELSRKSALNDKEAENRLVSSCYTVLSLIASTILIVFLIVYPFVNWGAVVNAESVIGKNLAGSVVVAIVISKILHIPFALIQRTEFAMQEGYKYNLFHIIGYFAVLISIVIIYYLNLGVMTMIWTYAMISVVVEFINSFIYYKFSKPHLMPNPKNFDKGISKKLINTGLLFFILSIFTSLSLSIDNFIVAHIGTLSDVTPYSIYHKIAVIIGSVATMLTTPMWTANGEAMARGEYKWVKKATFKVVLLAFLIAFVGTACICLLIKPALFILTDNIVAIDYQMIIVMCLMQIFVAITSPFFMVLNSAKIIKFQIVNYIIYAVISLPAKYLLGIKFGPIAIAWVGAICYALLLTIPTMLKALTYLNNKLKQKE